MSQSFTYTLGQIVCLAQCFKANRFGIASTYATALDSIWKGVTDGQPVIEFIEDLDRIKRGEKYSRTRIPDGWIETIKSSLL